jgi:hypothetical protein
MGRFRGSPPRLLTLAMAAASLLLAGREIGMWRFRLPEHRWQVPREWQHSLGRGRALAAYGAILGAGVFNMIASGNFYLLLMRPAVLGSPTLGVAGFAGFAIGRTIPVVAVARATATVEQAWNWIPLLDGSRPIVQVANALTMAACGGLLCGIALGLG